MLDRVTTLQQGREVASRFNIGAAADELVDCHDVIEATEHRLQREYLQKIVRYAQIRNLPGLEGIAKDALALHDRHTKRDIEHENKTHRDIKEEARQDCILLESLKSETPLLAQRVS